MKRLIVLLVLGLSVASAQNETFYGSPIPATNHGYNLGTANRYWDSVFARYAILSGKLSVDSIITAIRLTSNLTVDGTTTLDTLHGSIRMTGTLAVNGTYTGDTLLLGNALGTGKIRFHDASQDNYYTTLSGQEGTGGDLAILLPSSSGTLALTTQIPDTTSLSNRINARILYSDTTSVVAMQWELDGKSAIGHTHTQSNIAGLTDSIAAKPTRTELSTLLSAKLNYSDTTSTIANQWRLNAKQNVIPNLADTSKYAETGQLGTGAYLDSAKIATTHRANTFGPNQTFSGDIAVNGGDITTTASTLNIGTSGSGMTVAIPTKLTGDTLLLGNSNGSGKVRFHDASQDVYYTTLSGQEGVGSNLEVLLPTSSGTLALTSQVPDTNSLSNRINAKQNTIANLADTSKYIESGQLSTGAYLDSSKVATLWKASTFTANQSFSGTSTMNTASSSDDLVLGEKGYPGIAAFATEDDDGPTAYVKLTAPASVASTATVTLPSTTGTLALTSQILDTTKAATTWKANTFGPPQVFDSIKVNKGVSLNYDGDPSTAGLRIASLNDSLDITGTAVTISGSTIKVGGHTPRSAMAMDSLRVPALDEANTFTQNQTFSGDIAVNGGDITTTASTLNIGTSGSGMTVAIPTKLNVDTVNTNLTVTGTLTSTGAISGATTSGNGLTLTNSSTDLLAKYYAPNGSGIYNYLYNGTNLRWVYGRFYDDDDYFIERWTGGSGGSNQGIAFRLDNATGAATFAGSVIPGTSGNDLGSSGARWEGFFTSGDFSGGTVIGNGDNDTLIVFNSERKWALDSDGSGANTRLVLGDLTGGKTFAIRDIANSRDLMTILNSGGTTELTVTGTILPGTSGNDLGSSSNRWSLFADTVNTSAGAYIGGRLFVASDYSQLGDSAMVGRATIYRGVLRFSDGASDVNRLIWASGASGKTATFPNLSGTVAITGASQDVAFDSVSTTSGVSVNGKLTVSPDGRVTKVNNVGTEGNFGVPAIVGLSSWTSQNGSVSTEDLGGTTATGTYRISVFLECSASDAQPSSVYATINFEGYGGADKSENTSTISLSAAGVYTQKVFHLYHRGGGTTAINYTTEFTPGGGSSDRYDVYVTAERIN